MTAGPPIDGFLLAASLLALGILGWVYVDDVALVRDLSVIALVIILFEGGLTTKPSGLREPVSRIRALHGGKAHAAE